MSEFNKLIKESMDNRRVKDGLLLCDNCDNPASLSLSQEVGWIGCAPCITGEADSFDPADLICVERSSK